MFKKWIAAIMCVSIFMFSLVGCNGINPIGPIISVGIMWLSGEASKYYEADSELIHEATHSALKELDFPVVSEIKRGDTIFITADANDRFRIKVERVRPNITNLRIRVNIMGDKPYAELIYKKIDEYPGVKCFYTVDDLKTKLRE